MSFQSKSDSQELLVHTPSTRSQVKMQQSQETPKLDYEKVRQNIEIEKLRQDSPLVLLGKIRDLVIKSNTRKVLDYMVILEDLLKDQEHKSTEDQVSKQDDVEAGQTESDVDIKTSKKQSLKNLQKFNHETVKDFTLHEVLTHMIGFYKSKIGRARENAEKYEAELLIRLDKLQKQQTNIQDDQQNQLKEENIQLLKKVQEYDLLFNEQQKQLKELESIKGKIDVKNKEEEFQQRMNEYERRLTKSRQENQRLSEELGKIVEETQRVEVKNGELTKLKEENLRLRKEITEMNDTCTYKNETQTLKPKEQRIKKSTQNISTSNEMTGIPSLLEVTAEIHYLLGQMKGNNEISVEGLRLLEEELGQYFGYYTQHLNYQIEQVDSLQKSRGNLYEKIIQLEEELRLGGNKIEEKINQMLEKNFNTIESNLTKNIKETATTNSTFQPFSYAEVSAFPKLTVEKPKLILASKEEGKNSMRRLQTELNKLNSKDLPSVECTHTRTGKILLSCNSKTELQQIKQSLEKADRLKEIAVFSEVKPKKQRVIIFGAPEAPSRNKDETDEEQKKKEQKKIDEYELTIQQALERQLRYEGVKMKIIKIIKGNKEMQTSHLVVELLEKDALRLHDEKLRMGFYTCQVKKYLTVQRCFRCQMLNHTAATCTRRITCEICMGNHTADVCKSRDRPKCTNCSYARTDRYYPQPHIDTNHPASSNKCASYGWALRELIYQSKLKPQSVQNNKIQSRNTRY